MRVFALILALASTTSDATPPNATPEATYAGAFCAAQGGARTTLPGRLEVDCLTASDAWEVDHAPAYAGCIGQALTYAAATKRDPGCALILEEPGDCRYLARLEAASAMIRAPFRIERLGPEDCQ